MSFVPFHRKYKLNNLPAFTKDLLVDPGTRKATDVSHTVAAVASSSSKSRAEEFIKDCKVPGSDCKAYGSYPELVKDSNVDIIYVATPHSHHYQNVRLCLEAKKHVLCEKAFTVNAAQAKILAEIAKKNNLFLMEAVWTRYFPSSIAIRSMIEKGEIGEVLRVFADNSFGLDVEKEFGTEHRMTNLDLAGGALLDLGIYSLTWVFQTLYHTLPQEKRQKPEVHATMTHYHKTGADESTNMLLTFPTSTPAGTSKSHALASTAFRTATNPHPTAHSGPACRIQGTKGEIQVDGPLYKPPRYRVIPREGEVKEVENEFPGGMHGMAWEADEAARCVRDGKLESAGLNWEESIVIMETMDEVRKQGGLKYPEKIETTKYPVDL